MSATRELKNSCSTFYFANFQGKVGGNVKKGDKRITYADRQKIEAMERTGAKVTDIAKAVGFHRATIYNELKRGGTPYRAEVAQRSL